MVSDKTKFHLFFITVFSLFSALILLIFYLSIATLVTGIEEGGGQNPDFIGYAIMSGVWACIAIILFLPLIQIIRAYLDERRLNIPEVCPECKEDLHPSEIVHLEKGVAECPYCGVVLKITKEWDV